MPAASRPKIGQQLAALAVFDEVVGNAEAADAAGVEAGVGGRFQHGRAEAAHQRRLFDRDDEAAFADRAENRFGIERLDEAGVDHADVEAFVAQLIAPLRGTPAAACRRQTIVPSSPHESTSLLPNSTGVAVAGDRGGTSPSDSESRTGRRAAARSRASAAGRASSAGRHDDHVREHAQVAEVERAVMRRAVGPGEAGAIEHERDRQILQRDFLEDLVVRRAAGTCCRYRRSAAGRPWPGRRRRPRRAPSQMPVSKKRSGNASRTCFELVALAHRGGDHRDARVGGHLLVRSPATATCVNARDELFFICDDLVGRALELRRRVEEHRVLGGRLEAVALFGDDVQQDRALGRFDHPQVLAQQADVVAVDRAEVAEAEVLEQHAAVQAGLGGFLELRQEPLDRIAQAAAPC